MAGKFVPGVAPDGSPITLPEERVPELVAGGGRQVSQADADAEDASRVARQDATSFGGIAKEYGEAMLAGGHAQLRGVGEAVGLPLDRGITGVADLFGGEGARKSTASYLQGLDERHPIVSGGAGLIGNVAGAVGAGTALGAPGAIGSAPIAGARGVAARMAVGGVENVVQATTKDVNEAALGDKEVNGEMLVANMPRRLLVGGLLAGGAEGVAHVLGKGFSTATGRAVPALERAASGSIGRELGLEGERAVEAGARVRGLNGGEIPTSRAGLEGILTAEQGVQRGAARVEAEAAREALAGAQTAELALASARHETVATEAAEAGKRAVSAAERDSSEGILNVAAEAGAKVEQAELGAGARAKEIRGVADHYQGIHGSLTAEQTLAEQGLRELEREQADVAKQLKDLVRRIGDGSDLPGAPVRARTPAESFKGSWADEMFGVDGVADDPWAAGSKLPSGAALRGGRPSSGEKLGDGFSYPGDDAALFDKAGKVSERTYAEVAVEKATATGSQATQAEAARLAALHDSLAAATGHAKTHLEAVKEAITKNEAMAKTHLLEVARVAEAPLRTPAIQKAMNSVELAKARVAEVEAETAKYIEKAQGSGLAAVAKAEKRGAARIASAKADAEEMARSAAETISRERASMARTHGKQLKGLAPASEATTMDDLIKGFRARQGSMLARPIVSPGAMWGAGVSILHGNPMAAGTAVGASLMAGVARNHGNLVAARALRGLSTTLAAVDNAIRDGASSILGKTAGRAAGAATNMSTGGRREPSFDELSKNIVDIQANPMILEKRVRDSVGDIAGQAPGTYQEILLTSQRAHQFLLSILPLPERDPNTLTPHLTKGDVNETDKYDFMQSAKTIDDPLSIFDDIKNGSIAQSQVDAIQAVYPKLFDKMRAETLRQTMYLSKPLDYERELHVGMLLGQVTNQVMEPDFQGLMRESYAEKAEKTQSANASGSKPNSSGSSKKMMSGSESIEGGL